MTSMQISRTICGALTGEVWPFLAHSKKNLLKSSTPISITASQTNPVIWIRNALRIQVSHTLQESGLRIPYGAQGSWSNV